ncbi:MAG TPA: hypothetical protein VGC92_07565 [Phenylobacterium sp.]
MFDLSVVAAGGRWILLDEAQGQIGAFATREEALNAAGACAVIDQEPRHVLIQEDCGEWDETIVEAPRLH